MGDIVEIRKTLETHKKKLDELESLVFQQEQAVRLHEDKLKLLINAPKCSEDISQILEGCTVASCSEITDEMWTVIRKIPTERELEEWLTKITSCENISVIEFLHCIPCKTSFFWVWTEDDDQKETWSTRFKSGDIVDCDGCRKKLITCDKCSMTDSARGHYGQWSRDIHYFCKETCRQKFWGCS